MKRIEAVIWPGKLDEVKEALTQIGVAGMTVTEIKGFGQAEGRRGVYRGSAHVVDFMPKVMIEIVAVEPMVASIIDAIARAARTGRIGDGTIFVSEVVEVVRIRTGLGGDEAI